MSSSLTSFFLIIKKLKLKTNGIKRFSAINQSYRIVQMFELCRTLPKYLRTFLHKHAALTIGLTDQSDYSLCHFMIRLFICTVQIQLILNKDIDLFFYLIALIIRAFIVRYHYFKIKYRYKNIMQSRLFLIYYRVEVESSLCDQYNTPPPI